MRYKIINLKNFKILHLLIINLLYQIKYESFYKNEILNENILEDSENLLKSEGLLEDFKDIFKPEVSEDILKKSKDISEKLNPKVILEKSKIDKKFSNETYTDLMILVILHKLNNKTSNAIIKFFNKHLNLIMSSLTKNIEKV